MLPPRALVSGSCSSDETSRQIGRTPTSHQGRSPSWSLTMTARCLASLIRFGLRYLMGGA